MLSCDRDLYITHFNRRTNRTIVNNRLLFRETQVCFFSSCPIAEDAPSQNLFGRQLRLPCASRYAFNSRETKILRDSPAYGLTVLKSFLRIAREDEYNAVMYGHETLFDDSLVLQSNQDSAKWQNCRADTRIFETMLSFK